MADYRQEAILPDLRNLVINPSGESSSLGASYLASNGAVQTGLTTAAGAPAPSHGNAVLGYEVLDTTSLSYFFAPLGPDEPVHRGGFKIPTSKTVSFKLRVRASVASWVQIHASWMTERWIDGASAGLSAPIQIDPVGTALQATTSAWTTIAIFVPELDIPEGATHWRPLITVFSADPATTPAPPMVGTIIYAEELFLPDSGADLTGIAYADGDSLGWEWEGEQYYSSSRSIPDSEYDLEDIESDEEVVPTEDDVFGDETPIEELDEPEPTTEIVLSDTQLVALDVPDASVDNVEGARFTVEKDVEQAEKVIGWRNSNRHLQLAEDIVIQDLVMNTVDSSGVVWIVSDIEGWWTTPEPDVPDVPRAWFDGSYETRGRYGARTFTITGSFIPRAPGDVAAARDRLIRAVNLCHDGGWFLTHEKVDGETVTKGAKVWLAGQPLIATTGLNGKTDFSVALRAPDSLKHSIKDGIPPGYDKVELLTSSSNFPERPYPREYPWKYPDAIFGTTNAEINNYGNANAWPIIRLAGPTNGPVVIHNANTKQEMRTIRKLYVGEVLEIDCFTRQVTLNGHGNFRFYLAVDVDWLFLQPGPNRIWFAEGVIGTIRTKMQILWRSSWIG